jgi:hypothetical protein
VVSGMCTIGTGSTLRFYSTVTDLAT